MNKFVRFILISIWSLVCPSHSGAPPSVTYPVSFGVLRDVPASLTSNGYLAHFGIVRYKPIPKSDSSNSVGQSTPITAASLSVSPPSFYNVISVDGCTGDAAPEIGSPLNVWASLGLNAQSVRESFAKRYLDLTSTTPPTDPPLILANCFSKVTAVTKLDPVQAATNIANNVKQLGLDGISIQFEDFHGVIDESKSGSSWLEKLLFKLHQMLGEGNYGAGMTVDQEESYDQFATETDLLIENSLQPISKEALDLRSKLRTTRAPFIALIVPSSLISSISLFSSRAGSSLVHLTVVKYYGYIQPYYTTQTNIFSTSAPEVSGSAVKQLMTSLNVMLDTCRLAIAKPASSSARSSLSSSSPSGQFITADVLSSHMLEAHRDWGWFGGYANLDIGSDANGKFQQDVLKLIRTQCIASEKCRCSYGLA